MKLKLSVKERFVLPSLFLPTGDLLEQSTVKEIIDKTRITVEEFKKYKISKTPEGYAWDEKIVKEKDIELSVVELNFLKAQVTRINAEKKIRQETLSLCLKIDTAKNTETK